MTDAYGYLSVSFPVMEQGAQDLAQVHATLKNTLETLQSQLNLSLSDWTSEAKAAYYDCQQKWENDANEMATSLSNFGTFVSQAHDHYVNTEARNTGIWH